MALRTANTPNTDIVVLNAIKAIIAPNTALAQNSSDGLGLSQIFVQREFDMLNAGIFPAVLLMAGAQTYQRQSRSTFDGTFTAILDYYDRWDQHPDEFDDIRTAIALDLERMKSNIESQDSLATNGIAIAISLLRETLSPYEGIFRDYNTIKLVYRRLTLTFNVLDYDTH